MAEILGIDFPRSGRTVQMSRITESAKKQRKKNVPIVYNMLKDKSDKTLPEHLRLFYAKLQAKTERAIDLEA